MGTTIKLTSTDGFEFDAYHSIPKGESKGCVVILQEIFGVNAHIRDVCDRYAKVGYETLAPALFDRVSKGLEFSYNKSGRLRGAAIAKEELNMSNTLADIQSTINYLAAKSKVGVVGYCFGGTLAWLSAQQLNSVACASCYYGGAIVKNLEMSPKAPAMMHFGEQDTMIPISDVNIIVEHFPDLPIYTYDAAHGFNCDRRESYNEVEASLANKRTLRFLETHLGE